MVRYGAVMGEDEGVAGRSAQREYRRRLQLDRERARRERPRRLVVLVVAMVGGFLAIQIIAAIVNGIIHPHGATTAKSPFPPTTAHDIGVLFALAAGLAVAGNLWGKRQTTEAWGVGAEGERTVAARLEGVPGITVLHDRHIPRSRANIDHIAVGPSGVFVIDAKKVSKGRVPTRRSGPIWDRGPTKLVIGGRGRSRQSPGRWEEVLRLPECRSGPSWWSSEIGAGADGAAARGMTVGSSPRSRGSVPTRVA